MIFSCRAASLTSALLLFSACSSDSGSGPLLGHGGASGAGVAASGSSPGGAAGEPAQTAGASDGGRPIQIPAGGGAPAQGGGGAQETCTADFAMAELQAVYLAFAFDVSGSMGKLDEPHHDPALKWEPVVRATKSFFTDGSSMGMRASLTFFPAEEDRCDGETYLEPQVPMTALPSSAFGDAIDAIAPKSEDEWRGGTPTMAVLEGTHQFIETLANADPAGKYAVVLVSDGYPQGCSDRENDIEAVAEVVQERAERVPTYVVGVANPPGGPDTVTNLARLAMAGGTNAAFLIATGDAEGTARAFRQAVEAIRSQARSCVAPIPANPGGTPLDPQRVNVTLGAAPASTRLAYDASCADGRAWRYDDAANPGAIVLCADVCNDVQQELSLELNVEFGCERVDVIR